MAPSGAQTGPREYLESVGEKGEKVDKGDNWKIGQVGDKITTTGQTVPEGDKREPDEPDVETSSPSNSTDQGFLFGSDRSPRGGNLVCVCVSFLKRTLKRGFITQESTHKST